MSTRPIPPLAQLLRQPSTPPPAEISFQIALWRKWPKAVLQSEYRKGAMTFDLGFRQKVQRAEDRLFDLERLLRHDVRVAELVPPGTPRFGGYDPAGETRDGNALVTVGAAQEGALRVIMEVRLWRGTGLESAAQIALANERHRYMLLTVETVSLQKRYVELITLKVPGLAIAGYQTTEKIRHPELGMGALAEEIKQGMWALCLDDPYDTNAPLGQHEPGCQCAYHIFLADLAGYPGEARPYDALMACWFAKQGLKGDVAKVAVTGYAEDAPFDEAELYGTIPSGEIGGRFIS